MRPLSLPRRGAVALLALVVLCAAAAAPAAGQVTTPKEFFGHNIGDDYWLPNYTQFTGFWQRIARQSPRSRRL